MWHCFAEDEGGNFVTFYAKLNGLDTKEAYKQILEKYGALNEPQEKPKEKKPGLDHYTVSQYSFEKRLPEDWLKEQCCLQTKKDRNGVQYLYIPYFDAERNLALHRKRYGGKQFRWEYGKTDRLCMYGLWQIEAIRNIGYAVLVEGESDSQSMWYMGISTLGIPGASMMRADWAGVLQDLKLYIHVEPDKGGEAFLAKVTRALREGKFVGDPESWERAKEMARNILQEQMNADTGDVNENATQYIVDWILSNKDSFGEKAFGTCLGMIQNKNAYIFPSMLTQALTKAGYSSRKTLKYLADKGLIGVSVLKDGSTKNSVTKWFNNRNCRFVEFHLGDLAEEKDPLLEEEEIAEQMKPQQMSLPGTNDGWQTIPDEEADKLPFN